MDDWKKRLTVLEKDLSKKDPRPDISAYHDMPYAIFPYPPEEEFNLRIELDKLQSRLENKGKRITTILLSECLQNAIESAGLTNNSIAEIESISQEKLLDTIHEILATTNPLDEMIVSMLPSGLDPERDIIFITRAGSLFPVYRTSALLDQLHGKIKVPAILYYPGLHSESTGLKFMGVMIADGTYRARIY